MATKHKYDILFVFKFCFFQLRRVSYVSYVYIQNLPSKLDTVFAHAVAPEN